MFYHIIEKFKKTEKSNAIVVFLIVIAMIVATGLSREAFESIVNSK